MLKRTQAIGSPVSAAETGNPGKSSGTQRKGVDDDRTSAVLGAAIEVHKELGRGYLERVYHLALCRELSDAGVPYESEREIPVWYKGERLPATYRADFLCYGDLLVELKAHAGLGRPDVAQTVNYLKACRLPLGLLLNFGTPTLEIRRIVMPAHLSPGFPKVP